MKNFLKTSLSFLLIFAVVLSFSACKKKPAAEKNSSESTREYKAGYGDIVYNDARFYDFETGLIGKKLEYTEIIQLDQNLVGAKEVYAYKFEDNFVVELYAFDKDSEVYKNAVETNMIYSQTLGTPIPVKVNGTMCIYINDWQNDKVDAIYEIFKSLK